jgi:hypothetical protein
MTNAVKGSISGYFVDGPKSGPKGEYYIHSIYVDNEKYGGFGSKATPLANKGDTVEFNWTQNGKYRNFDGKSFKVLERATATASGGRGGSTNDSIARQNALRHATAMVLAFQGAYKRPDQMATEAVQICRDILFPYINDGTVCGDVEPGNNVDDSQPNDEMPF